MNTNVDTITDGLGRPIDFRIKLIVKILLQAGLTTDGSCEGHIDSGTGYPWIDVCSPIEKFNSIPAQIHNHLMRIYCGFLVFLFNEFVAKKETGLVLENKGIFGGFRIVPKQAIDIRRMHNDFQEGLRARGKYSCTEKMKYRHNKTYLRQSQETFIAFAKFLRG